MGGTIKDSDKLEYEAVLSAEDAARYFERLAAGIRRHEMVVESEAASVALDISSNVRIELEVSARGDESSIEVEVSWHPDEAGTLSRPELRVMPRYTSSFDDEGFGGDQRLGTPAGQLPLPEVPVDLDPQDIAHDPPGDLGDLAVDDVPDADVESALRENALPDDVFAENSEIAYESRAERVQPDTFMVTADGELRDNSDLLPDTALVEPIVQADESMGEASIGGAASTPVIADTDVDPASAAVEMDPDGGDAQIAPLTEVTPEEFD